MSAVSLTQAVTSGDAGAVSALLANGANVNERTSGGQTPLILATIFNHTHLISLLLNAGADRDLRDNLGLNALDWAQRRGATEAIALFTGKKISGAPAVEAEVVKRPPPPVSQSRDESEPAKPLSDGEKSQRWLAGLKQRIAEQSRIEPEPQITQIKQVEEPEQLEARPPQTEETQPLPPEPAKENPPQKPTRKRCPKCGAIYNNDLLAYCAHHFVELVPADDLPVISEPPRSSPVLLWMIIVITLTGSLVVGSLVTTYLYGKNRPGLQPATSPPTPKSVQKGIPLVDPALEGKVVSLPVAECPLNGQEAIPGTVVVRVAINKDGQVTSARASGGDWLLRGAATEAASKATFWPEKLRGRETEGTITYTFEP